MVRRTTPARVMVHEPSAVRTLGEELPDTGGRIERCPSSATLGTFPALWLAGEVALALFTEGVPVDRASFFTLGFLQIGREVRPRQDS